MITLYIDCADGFLPEMLLGALVDMGASVGFIEQQLEALNCGTDILHSGVKRHGMEATFAYCANPDSLQSAVFCAVECFAPDYIICGNMPDGCGDESRQFMDKIANEYGTAPRGYVMCDGYGAAPEELTEYGLLRVVLYNCGEPDAMLEIAEEQAISVV